MPWQWTPSTRRRRRTNARRYRRAYSDAYVNRRRNRYNDADGDDDMMDMDDGDDFDGFYDRRGNAVRLVIQTPSDMLPPTRPAAERNTGNWAVNRYSNRSRF
jgi:hypothetical protein